MSEPQSSLLLKKQLAGKLIVSGLKNRANSASFPSNLAVFIFQCKNVSLSILSRGAFSKKSRIYYEIPTAAHGWGHKWVVRGSNWR